MADSYDCKTCGLCGARVHIQSATSHAPAQYVCSQRKTPIGAPCTGPRITTAALDARLWTELSALVLDDRLAERVARRLRDGSPADDAAVQIARGRLELARVDRTERTLLERADRITPAALDAQLDRLAAARRSATALVAAAEAQQRAQRVTLAAVATLDEVLTELRAAVPGATPEERRELAGILLGDVEIGARRGWRSAARHRDGPRVSSTAHTSPPFTTCRAAPATSRRARARSRPITPRRRSAAGARATITARSRCAAAITRLATTSPARSARGRRHSSAPGSTSTSPRPRPTTSAGSPTRPSPTSACSGEEISMSTYTHNALAVDCDEDGCKAPIGRACVRENSDSRAPHPSRVAKARDMFAIASTPTPNLARAAITPGYEVLAAVLDEAIEQAQAGKGAERHAVAGEAYQDQQIVQLGEWMGSTAFAVGQACKKAIESTRLPADRARAELLGAINYLAAAVIQIDRAAAKGGGRG